MRGPRPLPRCLEPALRRAALGLALALGLGAAACELPRAEGQSTPARRKAVAALGRTAPASAPAPRPVPGVTFFVAADTHYGFEDVRDDNRRMIEEMNRLPGTAYPPELGGQVERPAGVLVAGDLTENGRPAEWQQFKADFGLTGTEGLLRFPVYEATGNHDRRRGRHVVLDGVRARHHGLTYSWDWQGIHFASLDRHPSASNRSWLARDLAKVPPRQPVVLFFHYNLEGPYSRYFKPAERAAFRDTIAAHNVVAIFHGHYHPEQRYVWNGVDVFDVGSPFWDTTFAVVRITPEHLQVASWNWIERRWGALFRRPLAPRVAAAPASQPRPPAR